MRKALMAAALALAWLGLPAVARADSVQWQLELLRAEIANQFNAERLERKQDRQFDDLMRAIQPRLPPALPPPLHNEFDLDKMMREAAEADRLRVGPLPSVGLYGGDPISVGPGYVAPLIGR